MTRPYRRHDPPGGPYKHPPRAELSPERLAAIHKYHRDYYATHPNVRRNTLSYMRVRGWERKEKLAVFKALRGCADCGERDPLVLDFDHLPGTNKIASLSYMANKTVAWPKIVAEIEKCDVVCANCHRRRTFSRKVRPTP